MAAVSGATEHLDAAEGGRRFAARRTVRLGDVDVLARLRLDATARWLQDVATDDVDEVEIDGDGAWLVRRTMITVVRPARLGERIELTTFCTGVGRSWAERSTELRGERGAEIDCVSVWITVDPRTSRPIRLTTSFLDVYGSACNGRTVSARLVLPRPGDDATAEPWHIRRTDLDPFDHVNNAAAWAMIEEWIPDADRRVGGVAEIEYVGPAHRDRDLRLLVERRNSSTSAWLVDRESVVTAARWTPHRPLSEG